MHRRHAFPPAAIIVMILSLFAISLAPVAAQTEEAAEPAAERLRPSRLGQSHGSLAVHHGPVVVSLATPESDGHQLGDLRVTSVPTTNADGDALGRLDATLTTTAVDVPGAGDEIRISSLVFSFDEEGSSQLVVGGTAVYPGQGSTIATGDTTIRPIVGGSGRFAGASGSAVTEHLDDDSWVHRFRFDRAGARGLDRVFERALRERARARLDDFKAERKAQQAERKLERDKGKRDKKDKDATEVDVDAGLESDSAESASDEVGITRIDLGVAQPASAPGEELGLWHYTIPAGSELAPHTHPGWQVARIAEGELEYVIIAGEGTLIDEDGGSTAVGPGTYTLEAGDSIVENPELEHYGANRTDEPVTIVAATLYPEGAPLSTPLEPAA